MLIKFRGCNNETTQLTCDDCALRWEFKECGKFRKENGMELTEVGRIGFFESKE